MAADPVRRRRGRPRKTDRRQIGEPSELDFEAAPEEEFFRDTQDLGSDLRRLELETGSRVYAGRRSLF